MESVAVLENQIAKQAGKNRPVHEYTIPEELKGVDENIHESVGLVKINPREERIASKKAGNDTYALAFELAKAALVEVDGKKINKADGEDDRVWNAMDPIIRQLVLAAYGDLHTVEDDLTKKFLRNKKMTIK